MTWWFTPRIAEAMRNDWRLGGVEGRVCVATIVVSYAGSIVTAVFSIIKVIV